MRKRLIILTAGVVVLAIVLFVRHARAEALFTKTISYVHFITKSLEQYHEDTGNYPESLEALTEKDYAAPELLNDLKRTSEVVYRKPPENAEAGFNLLEVRQGKRIILVSKEFERRVAR